MEIMLTNASNLCRVCILLGLVLSSSSASSKEPKTGSQANLNWTIVVQEVNEIMSDKFWFAGRYSCKISFSSVSHIFGNTANSKCDCSDQCMTYGGCCIDEAARKADQGIKAEPEKYMCWHLQNEDDLYKSVIMARNCLEIFVGSNMENLCFKQPSDVLYDPLLELPVISFKTNVTYLNYYCAQCNDDAMNLVPMIYKMECVTRSPPGIPHKYLYALKFPSANDFAMEETSAPQHYLLSETQDQYFAFSGFENKDYSYDVKLDSRKGKREIFGNSADLNLSCVIKNRKYEHFWDSKKNYETFPCRHASKLDQVQECNAKWENKEDFEKCRSYSLTASINETEYKNPHCARCNFENVSWLYVYHVRTKRMRERLFRHPQCERGWVYDGDMKDCLPRRFEKLLLPNELHNSYMDLVRN